VLGDRVVRRVRARARRCASSLVGISVVAPLDRGLFDALTLRRITGLSSTLRITPICRGVRDGEGAWG
jgi:hypothetical protein